MGQETQKKMLPELGSQLGQILSFIQGLYNQHNIKPSFDIYVQILENLIQLDKRIDGDIEIEEGVSAKRTHIEGEKSSIYIYEALRGKTIAELLWKEEINAERNSNLRSSAATQNN